MKNIIIANWKMYKTLEEIKVFKNEWDLNIKGKTLNTQYMICVPYIYLTQAQQILSGIRILAQDAHYHKYGAVTGNISWAQLKDINISGSLVGHSERRQFFNETNESVNLKTKALVENDMLAVVCVGETIEEFEADISYDVVWYQTAKALTHIKPESLKNIIIAYEPVWAIGTGKVPKGSDVNNLIFRLRQRLGRKYTPSLINNLPILYGGSVNDTNAAEFLSQPHINGALVGGFSLNAKNFIKLIEIGGQKNE